MNKIKVLLTGGSGMVGRNILEHKDVGLYEFLYPRKKKLNLLNYNETCKYIAKNKPDFVIHAAGKVGGIQANMAQPVNFLVENIDMGRNIIMASKNNDVKNFLNLASSCMYPRNAKNPLSESMILKGELEPTNEGYAIAKIMATRLCEYVSQENKKLLYKTIIPCNLYGKYDKFDLANSHMLPAVIKKIHDAKINNLRTIEIWGDGQARREFMYVGDLVDFIFEAIMNFERLPQNINVGLGHDFTIDEYYHVIAKIVGFKGAFKHDLSKPVGMKQKLIDDKQLKAFGWHYGTKLEEGIKIIYDYYKKQIYND